MTHDEKLTNQRKRRKENGNLYTKKYEKTQRGFLMRLYRNMKSRVDGIQKAKCHLYTGLNLLEREAFYCWALESLDFHVLWNSWTDSGYNRKLTPSVDRVDSTKGYYLDNMEWVTHSENSRRGAISKHEKDSSHR